jgi:hypothetical protein
MSHPIRPDKVSIGGMSFKVAWSDRVKGKIGGKKRQLYGLIDHDKCEIKVATAYDLQHQQVTLLHETFHGILTQARTRLSDEAQEELLEALDIGVWRFLRENPETLKWLLA